MKACVYRKKNFKNINNERYIIYEKLNRPA